jgi:hypothetical protein
MTRLRRAVAEVGPTRILLLCGAFVALNILDAWLTGRALGAGHYELNPFLTMRFGSNMLLKGLLSLLIVIGLILLKRSRLLKPLDLGMSLVCAWNGLVVWLWS